MFVLALNLVKGSSVFVRAFVFVCVGGGGGKGAVFVQSRCNQYLTS